MIRSRYLVGPSGLAVCLLVAACGSETTGPNPNPNPNPNSPPIAIVSANPTQVPAGDGNSTIVTIDASASTDADGDVLSFSWTVPDGTFENGTTASDPTIQVSFPGLAPYTVTVVVSDGNGGSDSGQITITLSTPVNQAPTSSFTASPTSVPAGDGHMTVVTLDGSASSDPDGDALTFMWTVPSGMFVGGTDANSDVAQVTFPGLGSYTVTLVVEDGNGGMDSSQFTIQLN